MAADPTDTAATDPYARQVCNCHHHTTEQHDDPPLADWDDDLLDEVRAW